MDRKCLFINNNNVKFDRQRRERERGFTLLGFEAVIIHTHCALLSYWIGKFGDVKVPDGPWRLLPHVFTVNRKKQNRIQLLLVATVELALVLATTTVHCWVTALQQKENYLCN